MSYQAMAWACEQETGGPSARTVLFALTNHAGDEGSTFVGLETIARESEQSRSSVIRRLADLEARGLIYRTEARRKNEGRHSGEFTSNLIVVLMNDKCVATALRYGYDPENRFRAPTETTSPDGGGKASEDAAPAENTEGQSDTRQIGESNENNGLRNHGVSDWNTVIPQHGVSDWNPARVPTVEREPVSYLTSTPQSPPDASNGAALDQGSWLGDWERFRDAWPWAAGELPEQVRKRFRELPPEDRAAAVGFVPAYLAEVRRRQGRPMQARRWVGLRGWEPFALAAKKRPTAKPGSSVPVIKDSDAWKAWLVERRARSFPTRRQVIDGRLYEVWDFPTLFPPGAARNAGNVDGRAGAAELGGRDLGAAR